MFTAVQKIHKDKNAEPNELARQIDVSGGKKAIVIHVPFRLRKGFRKIQPRLVRELEKKFSGKEVVLVATRSILRPPKKGSAIQRPRARILTSVHEAMIEDKAYPAEIVGKCTRYRLDGSKIMKVILDPKAKNDTESKLELLLESTGSSQGKMLSNRVENYVSISYERSVVIQMVVTF